MRNLRRRAAMGEALVMFALLAMLLSGCVHVDRAVTLNNDGSGAYTLTEGFEKQILTDYGLLDSVTQSMDTFGQGIKTAGGSYRSYEQNGFVYWAYTTSFSSLVQLNQELQSQPDVSTGTGATPPTSSSSDTFQVTEETGLLVNTFHATGHMSMVLTGDNQQNATLLEAMKDAHDSFAITMPGWVSSHSGGAQSGNTVTYTIHVNERAAIDVTGGAIAPTAFVIGGVGGAALALLAVVVVLVVVLLRRRAVPVPVAAPSYPGYPGYADNDPSPTLPGN